MNSPVSVVGNESRKRGRITGAKNYSKENIDVLIELVSEYRPYDNVTWQNVAKKFNERFPDLEPKKYEDLRRKFQRLASEPLSEDPSHKFVKRAKHINMLLKNTSLKFNYPNDDLTTSDEDEISVATSPKTSSGEESPSQISGSLIDASMQALKATYVESKPKVDGLLSSQLEVIAQTQKYWDSMQQQLQSYHAQWQLLQYLISTSMNQHQVQIQCQFQTMNEHIVQMQKQTKLQCEVLQSSKTLSDERHSS